MIPFIFIISAFYSLLIILYIKGWKNIPTFHFQKNVNNVLEITVVVACHNEEKNLPKLLQSLKYQSTNSFQLVLIDDNSTDNTFQIMQNAIFEFENLKILKSEYKGKKKALKQGIEQADNDLIITTDADCTPTPFWLESIVQFHKKYNSDLIIGPVSIGPVKSFFEKLQQTEFLSLVSAGAGAAGIKKPIMCNGANLAFKKELWLDSYSKIRDEINSGDDIFLLQVLKKNKKKISFLKSAESVIHTNPCSSFSEFYNQRKRWASKAPYYTDFTTIFVAFIVFLTAFLQVYLLLSGIFTHSNFYVYIILTTIKLIIDTLFLKQTATFFGQKITAKTVIPLAVIYPIYILTTSISGIISNLKNYR